jgi:two-component system, cell cycle sensor histidine kinase and response regulator CckA
VSADDRTYRVLIVDDEEPILRFVDRVLRQAGYDTTLAPGAAEALELLASAPSFDLLLTDLMMPGMRGDELAQVLSQRMPEIKVLYLTGYADRLFAVRNMLWANEAFVEKPVTVAGLREAVSLLLFGHTRGLPDAREPDNES